MTEPDTDNSITKPDLEWLYKWCEPIVIAFHSRDTQVIADSLMRAKEALKLRLVKDKDWHFLYYQLIYLEFQSIPFLKHRGYWKSDKLELMAKLAQSHPDPEVEGFRCRLYLQLRVSLDTQRLVSLDELEITELLRNLPPQELTVELYSYVANWALRADSQALLEEAYFVVSKSDGSNLDQWMWSRVDVQLKLLQGRADRADIENLIRHACLPHHITVITNLIWPRATKAGLTDEALDLLLFEAKYSCQMQVDSQIEANLKPLMGNHSGFRAE